MECQPDINERMRAVLVDWLVDVHWKYKQQPETLHLAVSIIDRYLTAVPTHRSELQLVGCTALLLASKHEESFRKEVTVADMVYVCDSMYTAADVRGMETRILAALSFRLSAPTAYTFMTRLLKAASASQMLLQQQQLYVPSALISSPGVALLLPLNFLSPQPLPPAPSASSSSGGSARASRSDPDDVRLSHFAMFLLDSTLQEYAALRFLPSELAAAAMNVALRSGHAGRAAWTPSLEEASGYSEAALRDAVLFVERAATLRAAHCPATLVGVEEKYSHARFGACFSTPVALRDGFPASSTMPQTFRVPESAAGAAGAGPVPAAAAAPPPPPPAAAVVGGLGASSLAMDAPPETTE